MSGQVSVLAPDGMPEVTAGADLAALLLPLVELRDGDVVVVTSKVVSKAEGGVVPGAREEHLAGETARVVARRGTTTIARTHHGLTLAAAGIDASNVATGSVVLLPVDPDASARRLRANLQARTGLRLAVVVTDTAGRAWREGQTDIAIGAAGLLVAEDYAGRVDEHGNELAVTAPAVADEVAAAAELAQGKLTGRPVAVLRGRTDLVLAPDDDGPGAVALVRPEGADMFGYGAREAVLRAVAAVADPITDPSEGLAPFGRPVEPEELAAVVREALGVVLEVSGGALVADSVPTPAVAVLLRVLGAAHGWTSAPATRIGADLRLRPRVP